MRDGTTVWLSEKALAEPSMERSGSFLWARFVCDEVAAPSLVSRGMHIDTGDEASVQLAACIGLLGFKHKRSNPTIHHSKQHIQQSHQLSPLPPPTNIEIIPVTATRPPHTPSRSRRQDRQLHRLSHVSEPSICSLPKGYDNLALSVAVSRKSGELVCEMRFRA